MTETQYLIAWGAWLLGGIICLIVWSKMLSRLPRLLSHLLWWAAVGAILTPSTEAMGSSLWAPASMVAFFDWVNHVPSGPGRAVQGLIAGVSIGLVIGLLERIHETRKARKSLDAN